MSEKQRIVEVDAAEVCEWRSPNGVGGVPGPVSDHPDFPDMTALWHEASVRLVRSYDWVSRLDTRNDPESLFPDWDADPEDPASYNFGATDQWVDAVHSIGAEVLFTFASAIPRNKLPANDTGKYGKVVEHIVRHYARGWADGPARPIRMFEFGDQPDFGPLHFDGPATDFYAMYEAFATAVKRVDDELIAGGPSLAFPLNAGADYREGFLSYVRERRLPLDFFSFLCFADATRDPMDFAFVAQSVRALLDSHGFTETKLMLSYWNYLAIPSNGAPPQEKAAFQAAAATYLQDAPIDYALFFRADSGKDPHYNFIDPAGIYGPDGAPDERAAAFSLIGQAMTGQRLSVTGGDRSGFACLAGRDGDRVRILLANFVAPESALAKRETDEFRFRVPIGPDRVEISFRLPPQRDDLASAAVESAQIVLKGLEPGRPASVRQQSSRPELGPTRQEQVSDSGCLKMTIDIEPQSVVLVEVNVL